MPNVAGPPGLTPPSRNSAGSLPSPPYSADVDRAFQQRPNHAPKCERSLVLSLLRCCSAVLEISILPVRLFMYKTCHSVQLQHSERRWLVVNAVVLPLLLFPLCLTVWQDSCSGEP